MQLQLNLCTSKRLKWAKMALSPIPRANYFVFCLATNNFFGVFLSFRYVLIILKKLSKTVMQLLTF